MIRLICLTVVFALLGFVGKAHACLSDQYAELNYHCNKVGTLDKFLQVLFPDAGEPRKIAVVAGVSNYPNLSSELQLPFAQADVDMMAELFTEKLGYDEVITIANDEFSVETISYIFGSYLPNQLSRHEKSQVVFSFSGHGADFDGAGYLFTSDTESIEIESYLDAKNTIGLGLLKALLQPTLGTAHQFLALINSCNGGHFLTTGTRAFGQTLREKGAHGITAGGANETVYARSNVGSGQGSVFFEMVNVALRGGTEKINGEEFSSPFGSDGILTVGELATFLHGTISAIEDNKVTPRADRIFPTSQGAQGQMFFVIDEDVAKSWMSRRFPKEFEAAFGVGPFDTNRSNTARVETQTGCIAPQTIGSTYDQAVQALRQANYNHERTDERHSDPEGVVIGQEPKNLQSFDCDEPLRLVVSEGPWLIIPEVNGSEYAEAISRLQSLKLNVSHGGGSLETGTRSVTPCEIQTLTPIVAETRPKAGQRVFEGSNIEIFTSVKREFFFTGHTSRTICP